MTVHRNKVHAKVVDAWEIKNAQSISLKELAHLYAKAIQAVERRSLATLSGVSVLVVVDRAVHETKEKFPILNQVKVMPEGIDLSQLFEKPETSPSELKNALRELLIELLNVFGNITADILTIPLHKELMAVTNERSFLSPAPQTVISLNPAKKNRERK